MRPQRAGEHEDQQDDTRRDSMVGGPSCHLYIVAENALESTRQRTAGQESPKSLASLSFGHSKTAHFEAVQMGRAEWSSGGLRSDAHRRAAPNQSTLTRRLNC